MPSSAFFSLLLLLWASLSSSSSIHHFLSGVLPPYVAHPLSVPRHDNVTYRSHNQQQQRPKPIITVIPVSAGKPSRDRFAPSLSYQFSGRPDQVRYIATPVSGPPVKPGSSLKDANLDDHILQTDSLINRKKQLSHLLPQVTPTASAVTTILPETLYQQERNRKLFSPNPHRQTASQPVVNTNKGNRVYSGSGHSNTRHASSLHQHAIPSSFSSFRHSLAQLSPPVNAIHPTDGSVQVDLRDLITKELEERSRMDPSLIQASGVNLFALLRPDQQSSSSAGSSNNNKDGDKSDKDSDKESGRHDVGGRFTPTSSVSFTISSSSKKTIPLSTVSWLSKKKNNIKDNVVQNKDLTRISHSHAPPKETPFNHHRHHDRHQHHVNPIKNVDEDDEEEGVDDETDASTTEDSPSDGLRHEDHHNHRDNKRPSSISSSPSVERLNPKISYVTHVDPPTMTTLGRLPLRPTKIPSVTYSTTSSSPHLTEKTTESTLSYTHLTDSSTERPVKPVFSNGRRPVDWSVRKNEDVFVNRSPPVVSSNKTRKPFNRNRGTSDAPTSTTTRIPMNSTETIDLSIRDHHGKSTNDPLSTPVDTRDQNDNSVLDDFLDPGTAADASHGHHIVNHGSGKNSSTSGKDSSNDLLDSYSESEPYRLTTERLAYILIGSCCALSILCLIVVAFSIRCRDMCDEYRAWKKAEKLAVYSNLRYTTQQHQPLGPGLPGHHLSRQVMRINGRTGVIETVQDPYSSSDSSTRPLNNSRPIFGPSCCCCPNPPSKQKSNASSNPSGGHDIGDSCPRGYFHPTPRGKLPFGAASSVHQMIPQRSIHVRSQHNNVVHSSLSEEEEDESLNTSMIEHPVVSNEALQTGNEGCTCSDIPFKDAKKVPTNHHRHNNPPHVHKSRGTNNHGPGKSSNPSWIQSSILVDELHRKHQQHNNRKTSNPASKVNQSQQVNQQHHHRNKSNINNNLISYEPQPHPLTSSNDGHRDRRDSGSNNNAKSRLEAFFQSRVNQRQSNQTTNFINQHNNHRSHQMSPDDQTRILWSGNDDRLI